MRHFKDQSFLPAQQGQLDALCGVYAACNFFFRRLLLQGDCGERWTCFQLMLKHLADRKKLTHLAIGTNGLKNGQIQAAFKKTASDLGVAVTARNLDSFMMAKKLKKLSDLLSSLADDKAVMVRVDNKEHWVLIHLGHDGQVILDDSYPHSDDAKPSSKKRLKGADLKNGLVFLNA